MSTEHDLICPECGSGLIVSLSHMRGGMVEDNLAVVAHYTPAEMEAAAQAASEAAAKQGQAMVDLETAREDHGRARTAARLAGVVANLKAASDAS